MHVCYIISDIDKAVFFEKTLMSLKDKKCSVSVILINGQNGQLHHFLIENNLDFFLLENKKISTSFLNILKCRKFLKKIKPEIVHCHLAHANWIGLISAKLSGVKKRIYTRHSGELIHKNWKEKIIDKIQNLVATDIVSISKVIDDLLKKQGVSDKKRTLIHHGFELERFDNSNSEEANRIRKQYNPKNNYPTIGVIARWIEFKGIEYIVQAFEKFIHEEKNAHLFLFGADLNLSHSDEILKALENIPKENYSIIKFENNVFDLYHLFDIYVHVPINPFCEAFGQTYIEALAAGVPSIFTLSGVATEVIVDKENAIVVPFVNHNAIFKAFIELTSNDDLREKLIANGKKMVNEKFLFETYLKKLIDLYEK